MFCVCFGTGGNSEIDWKHSAGHRKQSVQKMPQNRSRARFGMDLGVIFGVQLATHVVFCRKNECKKTSWKKVPPKSETTGDGHVPGLPDSPPKVKDCLSNKQQLNKKQQQFNKNTNNCRVVASVRLLLCLFLVRFFQFDCCCFCVLFDF